MKLTSNEMNISFGNMGGNPMSVALNQLNEPTLNTINNIDYNTSFDNFIQNVKLASAEVNWNDIDTSQFKCNNWGVSLFLNVY